MRHPHSGLPWHGSRVQEALANPVYASRVVINRRSPEERTGEGNSEPLIDPQTFDRVGMKIGFHRRGRGGKPTSRYALSGLAVCDRCGRRMSGRTDPYVRKDGTQLRAYVCANKVAGGTCDAPRVDAERIDRTVVGHLQNLVIDVDAWKGELVQTAEKQRAQIDLPLLVGQIDNAWA